MARLDKLVLDTKVGAYEDDKWRQKMTLKNLLLSLMKNMENLPMISNKNWQTCRGFESWYSIPYPVHPEEGSCRLEEDQGKCWWQSDFYCRDTGENNLTLLVPGFLTNDYCRGGVFRTPKLFLANLDLFMDFLNNCWPIFS